MQRNAVTVVGLVMGAWMIGCGGGSSHPPKTLTVPPSSGGSGAFGVVTIAGHQKMYLPQPSSAVTATGNATIAVVDVGVAGNGVKGAPALVTTIDLGTPDLVTATSGDATIVLAVSTNNPRIYFIDPSSDQVLTSITLDSSYGVSSFSGGGGYVTGVAVDSPNQRAYLSVWNGFAIVDLSTMTIAGQIPVPPSENFGFDSVSQRLYAPFYDCSSSQIPVTYVGLPFCDSYADETGLSMIEGLNVIDLTDDNTVYTYQDPHAATTASPVGSEPDSAAADPATGQVVVPSEGDSVEYVIDFADAKFDKTHKWVTAPHVTIDATNADELTGVAVEPYTHIAFFESEEGSDMGAADLTKATKAMSSYTRAQMPPLPNGYGWVNLFDPHGIAVTTGIADGNPVGFLVNEDYSWVARVELAKLLALPTTLNLFNQQPEVADASGAVTYLDATTKP
jgi:hypothetical protein